MTPTIVTPSQAPTTPAMFARWSKAKPNKKSERWVEKVARQMSMQQEVKKREEKTRKSASEVKPKLQVQNPPMQAKALPKEVDKSTQVVQRVNRIVVGPNDETHKHLSFASIKDFYKYLEDNPSDELVFPGYSFLKSYFEHHPQIKDLISVIFCSVDKIANKSIRKWIAYLKEPHRNFYPDEVCHGECNASYDRFFNPHGNTTWWTMLYKNKTATREEIVACMSSRIKIRCVYQRMLDCVYDLIQGIPPEKGKPFPSSSLQIQAQLNAQTARKRCIIS